MKILNSKSVAPVRRWKIIFVSALAVVFLWANVLARPFRPVEQIPANIVDMNCHVAGIGAGGSGCFVSPQLRHNWRFRIYLRSFGVSQKEILNEGDGLIGDRISES